jgi:adenylylsulfate kinase-like enzyme
VGGFILTYVATGLRFVSCATAKVFSAKARAGILEEFIGISDSYEAPQKAEGVINRSELSAEEAPRGIILHLERQGFIGVNGDEA